MPATIKSPQELEKMRAAGSLAAQAIEMIEGHVRPGVSTGDLDRICHDYIVDELGAVPAALNYKGFPKSVCTSVNEVVCHGIPSADKVLKSGDILNIDIALIKDGYFGDTSKMFLVGKAAPFAARLCEIAQQCLYQGIEAVKPGATLGDIGAAVQGWAEKHYYSVVREYCGHGIGAVFHDEPQVLHYGKPGEGLALQEGMTFTIEPMINLGRRQVKLKRDGWTVVTRDGRLSAQWEHTLAVTAAGVEVLTARKEEPF